MAHRLASRLRQARHEPAAFTDFYSAHSPQLLVFFVRRTFDVEAARDLTAETFAQAFEHRGRFRGLTNGEARGWLYGIARHQLSRYARTGAVERRAVNRLGIQLPTVSEDDYERIVELAGLGQLRDNVAAAFGELSYFEVAQTLGISEQTARARVSKALRRLADAIDLTSAAEVTP
jgi:RNA polymerase sigma factor (sigma-70 family)